MNKPYNRTNKTKIQLLFSGTLIGAAIFLVGCAANQVDEQQNIANKADPYENINRKVFVFNDKVDDYVAKPISDAYKWITPDFMQTGVSNFFSNIKDINVVINDILQAKFAQSAHDTGRFALNTTMGLAGVVDVATQVGLERNDEDFEQTLAVWGIPQGSYLVIPFLGPSTMRGIPGAALDTAANPASYVGMPVQLLSLLNARANAEGALKFIDEASLDPYVFTRESFLQWRKNLATDGKSNTSLDLGDEVDEEVTDSAAKQNTKKTTSTQQPNTQSK
jgi:phospholipid-binding lipoprotein MlaA